MAWWLNLEPAAAEIVTSSVPRPAYEILNLPRVRDNWVYGNPEYVVHSGIDPTRLQRIDNPAGPPIVYYWDP